MFFVRPRMCHKTAHGQIFPAAKFQNFFWGGVLMAPESRRPAPGLALAPFEPLIVGPSGGLFSPPVFYVDKYLLAA